MKCSYAYCQKPIHWHNGPTTIFLLEPIFSSLVSTISIHTRIFFRIFEVDVCVCAFYNGIRLSPCICNVFADLFKQIFSSIFLLFTFKFGSSSCMCAIFFGFCIHLVYFYSFFCSFFPINATVLPASHPSIHLFNGAIVLFFFFSFVIGMCVLFFNHTF